MPVFELAGRRTGVVVDEAVGLGTGIDEGLATGFGGDIGGDRMHPYAGVPPTDSLNASRRCATISGALATCAMAALTRLTIAEAVPTGASIDSGVVNDFHPKMSFDKTPHGACAAGAARARSAARVK